MTITSLSTIHEFTPEQMHLITKTIAPGATPDELKLFLYRCGSLGLDPLKPGQIYFIKYGAGPGTIVVGIEGFRARAGKTGKLSGIKRGAIKDSKGILVGAYAEVYRSDWKECAREEVPLNEYDTKKGNWAKMPETMIKKVAEAAALRMAFPDDLGGIYTDAEMDQAEKSKPVIGNNLVVPETPGPNDGVIKPGTGTFIKYGRFAGQWLNQIDPTHLRQWIQDEEAKTQQTGKSLTPWMKNVIAEAEIIIADYENQELDPIIIK